MKRFTDKDYDLACLRAYELLSDEKNKDYRCAVVARTAVDYAERKKYGTRIVLDEPVLCKTFDEADEYAHKFGTPKQALKISIDTIKRDDLDNVKDYLVKKGLLKEGLKEDYYYDSEQNNKKAIALADYFGCDIEDIEDLGNGRFSYEDGEYVVYTEDEAYEKAKEDVRELYDDLGLESFSEYFQQWIMDYALDERAIEEMMINYYRDYVEDIENESSMEFDNCLIEELYDNDILSDESFELDEDGEIDFFTLKDEIDIESLKDDYVNILVKNETPSDWLNEFFSDTESLSYFIKDNNHLIDLDKVVEEAINEDGVAHFIATYDGEELELEGDFFAYRIN